MLRTILASTAVIAVLLGSSAGALAQDGTVKGAAGGAVTGAIVGTAIDPPPQEVVTYVQEQPAPAPVTVSQEIVVGKPVPETVVLTPVPSNEHYAYAVVNDQRVIIDPRTHTVVQVVR